MTKMILQSERLWLREFTLEDASVMYELNSDIEVVRYTGDVSFGSIADSEAFLKNYDVYKKHGMGRWLVLRKSDEVCLGWCGLKMHTGNWVDLGYRFFKRYWNMGYATEASRASVQYGFERLGLTEVYASVMPVNTASARVLEKLGFQEFKEVEDELMGRAVLYELKKENLVS